MVNSSFPIKNWKTDSRGPAALDHRLMFTDRHTSFDRSHKGASAGHNEFTLCQGQSHVRLNQASSRRKLLLWYALTECKSTANGSVHPVSLRLQRPLWANTSFLFNISTYVSLIALLACISINPPPNNSFQQSKKTQDPRKIMKGCLIGHTFII